MKNELKISTVSIICVLCSSVMSGAYAASSVRSLGGAGTYSSAASASQSGTSTGVARAGSVRVTPTSGKATAVKPSNSPSTTAGRVASPRLSLGKYLGGSTAISGGSSTRPGGGTSGGGSSSTDPGLSGGWQDRLAKVEDDLKDLKSDKQDRLVPSDYIGIDDKTDEVYLRVDALGNDTEASVENGILMLSIAGGPKVELIALSELLTADDMDAAIDEALKEKGFATAAELKAVADDVADNKDAISKNADAIAVNTQGIAANKEAIESIKVVSGDVADMAEVLSKKADKQDTATKDAIAIIGDGGQYVGSDKKLSDFATTADVSDFDKRMTELKTNVEKNMDDLEQELAGINTTVTNVNNTVSNIVNDKGQIKIAPNSITALELADGSVTNTKLAPKAVKLSNLDTEVSEQLVGAPDGETDGMYVMLVTPDGTRYWADLALADETDTESGGGTN